MIERIILRQFRGHEQLQVDFKPDVNLIVGPNGSGKTSVLEAIYTTLNGKSWRGSSNDLIKHGSNWATVEVVVDSDIYKLELDARDGNLKKTRYINKDPVKKGFPNLILLEPNMIDLVTSGPSQRREWLDQTLTSIDADYGKTLAQYERSLSQRNALLKREVRNKDQLFVWNIKLAELGAKLATARYGMIDKSSSTVKDLFESTAGYSKSLSVNYQPKFEINDYSQAFMNYLESKLERDIAIGFTPTGPHREDIELTAESGPARDHLSRGEQLILAFALVYSQAANINPAAVLIDDYTSDLDQEKSEKLIKLIKENKITTSTTKLIFSQVNNIIELK